MDIILSKEKRRVAHAAAKPFELGSMRSASQFAVQNVCIRGKELIAADGYVLAKVDLPEDAKTSKSDVLIPAKEILQAKNANNIKGVRISRKKGSHEVRMETADGVKILDTQKGKFPAIPPLIPKTKPVFRIVLAKKVLLKICNMMEDDGYVAFRFYGETESVAYETKHGINGIVMPMIIPWKDDLAKKTSKKARKINEKI